MLYDLAVTSASAVTRPAPLADAWRDGYTPLAMPSLDEIRRALAVHEPEVSTVEDPRRAAVALVLHDVEEGPEMLFIERAEREGDPWSGHMAFPGGRVDARDAGDPQTAAERETREEVGLDLVDAARLGRLGDLSGHPTHEHPLVISAFVYAIATRRPLTLNHEVRAALWVPVRALVAPTSQVAYPYPRAGNALFPGVRVGESDQHVVWGLTYRFLEGFFAALGTSLPTAADVTLRKERS